MRATVQPGKANPELAELSLRIGGCVRTLRQARGMYRRMLSKVSGVSERYLAQLETGNGNVTVGIFIAFPLYLAVPWRIWLLVARNQI